ncbi:MAG TPA: hypothetical protein VL946_10425 [Lacibacter sp.]|jgi:hypothetical protein|nr:hypothetical protein [Lacibacter sp.]
MRKTFTLFFLIFTFSFSSFAQRTFQRNSFYIEAFGSGLFGSLNYERQLTKQPGIGVRVGVGFYAEKATSLTIPVGINYLFPLKRENRFVDAGFTVSPTFRDANFNAKGNDKWTNFVPSVGYRVHTEKDWMWRISITPVINRFAFTPSAGFSIGKVF